MKKLDLVIALILFGFISVNAQSDSTKEKLKELDGNITKITIETENSNVDISGEDANILFNKMKTRKAFMIKEMHSGDSSINVNVDINDVDGEKVVVVKKLIDGKEIVKEYKGKNAEKFLKEHSGINDNDLVISDDGEITVIVGMDGDDLHWISNDDDCLSKKIKVEENDGVKKVTVTTTEDGNENIEIYEGEEADEFLEQHSKGKNKIMFIEDDDITTITMDSDNLHWISEDKHNGITKKVNVEIKDDEKTVTVTTIEDGEEKVEVYEGEEADKYLEKMDHGKKMKIHICEDGNKKEIKKKMILIKVEEDND